LSKIRIPHREENISRNGGIRDPSTPGEERNLDNSEAVKTTVGSAFLGIYEN
jgi:hypothetical protein